MPETCNCACVQTNKQEEAIYEYSTLAKLMDHSRQAEKKVYLFYNGGSPQLRIVRVAADGSATEETIELKTPKKPDDTPGGWATKPTSIQPGTVSPSGKLVAYLPVYLGEQF